MNAAAVNSWRLYRKIHGNKIPLLKFVWEITLETFGKYGRNRPSQGLNVSGMTGTSIKLDTFNRVIVKGNSKYCRCKECGRWTIFKCKKCNVSLHPECMKSFHDWCKEEHLSTIYLYIHFTSLDITVGHTCGEVHFLYKLKCWKIYRKYTPPQVCPAVIFRLALLLRYNIFFFKD